MENEKMDRAARRREMRDRLKPAYALQKGYLESYPNDDKPKDRVGGVHRPHWILKHNLNAEWVNGVGNTAFSNREDRRRKLRMAKRRSRQ